MSDMVNRVAMRLSAEMPNGATTRDMREIARAAIEEVVKELDSAPYKYSWFDAYETVASALLVRQHIPTDGSERIS